MDLIILHFGKILLLMILVITPSLLIIQYYKKNKALASAAISATDLATDIKSSIRVDIFWGLAIGAPTLIAVVYAPKIIIDLFFPFYAKNLWMYLLSDLIIAIAVIAIYCLFFPSIKTKLGGTGFFLIILITAIIHLVWIYHGYTQNKISDKEEQLIIQKYYYEKAQKITIPVTAEIKTPKERQKAITRLSEKVDFLVKANRYNHRYEVEYQKWRERLGFERALVKYEAQWGPARMTELTESDKWIETGLINPGDRIKYLSNAEFLFKYEKGDGKFKSAITEPYGARFSRGDMVGDQTPVWFSKLKQKATVYSWIIKNG
ncbi:hypothetical protein KAJ61_05330 [Candidatus Parcubacteria bacterium]|nr:hypothetical protein [Candidatus Parcubacteria bacterium]